jgi:hypothetical protein
VRALRRSPAVGRATAAAALLPPGAAATGLAGARAAGPFRAAAAARTRGAGAPGPPGPGLAVVAAVP